MRRILILTYHKLWPPATGFHGRVCNLIRHLHRRGHLVDLMVTPLRPLSRKEIEFQRRHVDAVHVLEFPGAGPVWTTRLRLGQAVRATGSKSLERFARCVLGVGRRGLRPARRFVQRLKIRLASSAGHKPTNPTPGLQYTSRQQEAIRNVIQRGNYDVIIVEHVLMASSVFRKAQGDHLWIIDMLDVMHERTKRHRQANLPMPDAHVYTREQERDALRPFDVIMAIQDEEAETFKEMLPEKQVICVRMDFPVQRISTAVDEIAFVGNGGAPNTHGVERLLREAWPEVVRVRPDAVLGVYGAVCEADPVIRAAARFPKSLILHGFVDDLTEAYRAGIVIAPLWVGSGLKIKVVEALCHGKAVITTPVGAQGLADGAGRAFRVAETPAEFATHILDLLAHPQKREALADAAYHYAACKFAEDNVYQELDQILEQRLPRLSRCA